jgi:predicted esterase
MGQAADEPIVLQDALVIGPVGLGRRSAVHTDAIEARIVAGTWSAPREGATIEPPDGETRTWKAATADEKGWLGVERGGYASFEVESDRERAMILHARGHSLVYVNGALRAGDPYNTGYVRLPILLKSGRNELLFRVGRGRLWARLLEPGAPVTLHTGDLTLPDLVRGEAWSVQGGIVVINATAEPLDDLTITAGGNGLPSLESDVPPIAPFTIRKVPFWCGGPVAPDRSECRVRVRLQRGGSGVLDETTVRLRVVEPTDRHRRTFRSAIDGSVQYYAVTPMKPATGSTERPALFLTLHGAGVEARGQAAAYRSKSWGHVVAPTNRRYLTGHSMGGHGAWNFGVTYPDRFAAIGPSAGWISFWSYAGAPSYDDPDAIEAMLVRAASDSDTLALARNYLHSGIYILHGEKDNNVPAEQSRQMYDHLAAFHPDVIYHEEPGSSSSATIAGRPPPRSITSSSSPPTRRSRRGHVGLQSRR